MNEDTGQQGHGIMSGKPQPDDVVSADDLIFGKFSERVARDMSAAITALEGCRQHVKTPQALAALDRTVDRLQEASHVHSLLACSGPGLISLEESVYALAVSMRRSETGLRPVQLTFELEPVKAGGSVSRVVLHFLAEVIAGLMSGPGISDDTIGVRFSLAKGVLELSVSHATAGERPPSFELAPDTITLAGHVGAHITRRHSPTAAEWRIAIRPPNE